MRGRTFLCLLLLSLGCARGPNVVSEQLPLRRVVIYRNGVGYFERAGNVDDERVGFRMRQRMVGDFLASLAIVERGGSSVRAASFPLELEDTERPDSPAPMPRSTRGGKHIAPVPPPETDPDDMREVVLYLDGKEHDLSIGYLAETPVWRPSYRVVVREDGSADLQAWGIVQNLSGEDWTDVELALVAGAPLAFQSTLGNPVIPERPVVSDRGEIIAAMPTGVTTLHREPQAEAAEEAAAAVDDGDADAPQEMRVRREATRLASKKAAADAPPMAPPAPSPGAAGLATPMSGNVATLSAPRRLEDLAAVALQAGTTRYEIPTRVTVPNDSATMVLLLSQRIPGEAVLLFSPDGAVSASARHPYRVARFTNSTRGLLERGPIAVFERGSFLGQGLVEPLPPKATATVPFALERGVAVTSHRRYDEQGSRLHRVEAGQLFIERDHATRTHYEIENGENRRNKLLIRHPRISGTRLHAPPKGTEEESGGASALVPVQLAPSGKTELVVDERRPTQQHVEWLSPLADEAVQAYLADPKADQEAAKRLREAFKIREVLKRAVDERTKLEREQNELENLSHETRKSLRAIEKNAQAADLRQKLTARLADATERLDRITKRLIEVGLTISEHEVRFRDAVQGIRIDAPPQRKSR
ncbi:MAG TPA: DUF4139 domain-containing protein [Polyangiaceae bacterium]|nr:DUF4139 domain-containing protein [Polyangiaceae bacterium]